MTEQNKKTKMEEKKTAIVKTEVKNEDKKMETKTPEKSEVKIEDKKPVKVIAKKSEAITKGNNLHASMKQCKYICRFIKNKSIDSAIADLEKVIKLQIAVPFAGEIPHRKGAMMSGRYPINASKLFIPMLKTLKGNVLVNQMDLDKTRIYFASSSFAARPSKKGGGRFKRANIVLKAKEFTLEENKSGDKK